MKKVSNYQKAFAQLAQAVEIYTEHTDNSLYRDGLIQRFEFTVELAWKSLKEYLEDQGMAVEYRRYAQNFFLPSVRWLTFIKSTHNKTCRRNWILRQYF